MESIKQKAYKKYQMDWMRNHIHLDDINEAVMNWSISVKEASDFKESFEEYLECNGFGGMLWACFEEFLQYEYQQRNYIMSLLRNNEDCLRYLDDIGDGYEPHLEMCNLISECIKEGVLQGTNGQVAICRENGDFWEPVQFVAKELMYDKAGRDCLREALVVNQSIFLNCPPKCQMKENELKEFQKKWPNLLPVESESVLELLEEIPVYAVTDQSLYLLTHPDMYDEYKDTCQFAVGKAEWSRYIRKRYHIIILNKEDCYQTMESFYDMLLKKLTGTENIDDFQVNCTHIRVSDDVRNELYRYYMEEKNAEEWECNMLFALAGPKADLQDEKFIVWTDQMFVVEKEKNEADANIPIPDTPVSVKDMRDFGYSWDGMLPLQQETAEQLLSQGLEIFCLYADGTEGVIEELEDLRKHAEKGGLFGIEKEIWKKYMVQVDIAKERTRYDHQCKPEM